MTDFVVAIPAFDDVEHCQYAIESIPDDIPVHVFDGRYVSFDGDQDLTDGLSAVCGWYDNVTLHTPSESRLPFGHSYTGPLTHRPGLADKAHWMYHEVLPQDTWVLKMDTDEEFVYFTPDALDEEKKYIADIQIVGSPEKTIYPTRAVVPRFWTAWINDCFIPRGKAARDTPLEQLVKLWKKYRSLGWSRQRAALLNNRGVERPSDYRERRRQHLVRIGREDVASNRQW